MSTSRRIGWAWLLGLALVALGVPGWAGAADEKHSGTVEAVNQSAGTVVLAEIGPWHIKGGETEITRRTIAVTAATEFARVKRMADAGPSGWRGDFAEAPLPARQVKPGDFVTVMTRDEYRRPTAAKVIVIEFEGP